MDSVTILTAIRWIANAWEKVHPLTIQKCFCKAGVLTKELEVVSRSMTADCEDPFADLDDDTTELQTFISEVSGGDENFSVEEYLHINDDLPICSDSGGEDWEQKFFVDINTAGSSSKSPCRRETDMQEEDENNESDEDEAPLPPRLKSLNEAIHNLKDVC